MPEQPKGEEWVRLVGSHIEAAVEAEQGSYSDALAADLGLPAPTTWGYVVRGKRSGDQPMPNVGKGIKAKIETTLGWPRGAINRLLAGEPPETVIPLPRSERDDPTAAVEEQLRIAARAVAEAARLVEAFPQQDADEEPVRWPRGQLESG